MVVNLTNKKHQKKKRTALLNESISGDASVIYSKDSLARA